MLEDFTMEKKSCGRSAQPLGKGNANESKKNQDVLGCKVFPRSLRRREPVNPNGPKYEPNRRPAPQKGKSLNKRPRPRGQLYGSGKEDTKVAEEVGAEYGSVVLQGSKKQNLNHLLNFHYAPREGATPNTRNWRSGSTGWGRQGPARWLMTTHKHKYNKEQFLQANCQFVVKSDGNYTPYITNPDMLVDWELIEQIRLQSAEMVSCPICLYPPVAAKMTRCGHVYCWPCILHYLSLSDKSWRKCPICYESVHKQDLKSVIAIPHGQFSVGGEITLRLMKRERGSLLPIPVDQYSVYSSSKLLSVSETAIDTVYSKLLLATPNEVRAIVDQEKSELEVQLADEQGCPEICFVEQALEELKGREVPLVKEKSIQKQTPTVASIMKAEESVVVEQFVVRNKSAIVYNSAFDDEYISTNEGLPNEHTLPLDVAETEDHFDENSLQHGRNAAGGRRRYESVDSDDGSSSITVEDLETPAMQQSMSGHGQAALKHFYFYQAADGQHIYLHALNVRMLEHRYGSLENSPATLTGRIVQKEAGSMTEELRHRLRYLQHLPVTCQFDVVEIQMKPSTVSRETLEHFQEQLEVRRRRRQRHARDERRREKHISDEENRRWGRYPAPHIRIESRHHFPQCGTEVDPPGMNCPISSAESSVASSPTPSHDSISSLSVPLDSLVLEGPKVDAADYGAQDAVETCGPSFAQMLRDGKSRDPVQWPAVQKSLLTARPGANPRRSSDSEPEPEGYVPVPTFRQSFSDAIALALEKAAATKEVLQDGASSGKKKKKQKQKILFATGMACTGK